MLKLTEVSSPHREICQFCKDIEKAFFSLKLVDRWGTTENDEHERFYCKEHFENLIDELKNALGKVKLGV